MFIPKFFILAEFLPPELIGKVNTFIGWSLIDERILVSIEKLRIDLNKKIIINNWKWNGQFKNRGLRLFDSTTGAIHSQHKFGRALDFDVDGMNAEEVRKHILDNKDAYPHITAMETDVNWVHIDCRYLFMEERIKLFKG